MVMSSLIIVSYKCVMKHEGYIPATVVSGGDTLTIRKKISGSACLIAGWMIPSEINSQPGKVSTE
jgi:hypothetical protein